MQVREDRIGSEEKICEKQEIFQYRRCSPEPESRNRLERSERSGRGPDGRHSAQFRRAEFRGGGEVQGKDPASWRRANTQGERAGGPQPAAARGEAGWTVGFRSAGGGGGRRRLGQHTGHPSQASRRRGTVLQEALASVSLRPCLTSCCSPLI